MKDCIFCKIIHREIPSRVIYEDDLIMAFHDIDPMAPQHAIVVPKHHVDSLNDINSENLNDVKHLTGLLPLIAKQLGIKDSGYRVVINCGSDGGQSVSHLHYHILGGRMLPGLGAE